MVSTQTNTHAWGYGLATIAGDGTVLDTWYPAPQLGQLPAGRDKWIVPAEIEDLVGEDARRNQGRGQAPDAPGLT